jgi:hypothetical protein
MGGVSMNFGRLGRDLEVHQKFTKLVENRFGSRHEQQ